MKTYFDSSKKQYKANLHCHTTTSDGRAAPETVKEEYKKRGYSVVAYTDHEHLFNYKHLTDEDFIAINGFELGITGPKVDTYSPLPSSKQLHVNLYSKDPDCDVTPFYSDAKDWYRFEDMRHLVKATEPFERKFDPETVNALVARAHELGFLVSLNHPNWSLLNAEDYLAYEGFDFIEVHNTGCVRSGHHTDEAAYNDIMKSGKRIFCVATDDNHNGAGFDGMKTDSFGGWTMIAADALGYKEIMDALEAGDFYATTGPEIYSISLDDSLEESVVKVSCSPAKRAYLITQGRRNARDFPAEEGMPLTEAKFKLYPQDTRFRIRIDDEHGNSAWSQIYEIPEDAPRVIIKK
jgi:hypothetical protein